MTTTDDQINTSPTLKSTESWLDDSTTITNESPLGSLDNTTPDTPVTTSRLDSSTEGPFNFSVGITTPMTSPDSSMMDGLNPSPPKSSRSSLDNITRQAQSPLTNHPRGPANLQWEFVSLLVNLLGYSDIVSDSLLLDCMSGSPMYHTLRIQRQVQFVSEMVQFVQFRQVNTMKIIVSSTLLERLKKSR